MRRGELLRAALLVGSAAVAASLGIPSPVLLSTTANHDALRSLVAIAGGRSAVSYGLTGGASGYGGLWFEGESGGAYSTATPSSNNRACSVRVLSRSCRPTAAASNSHNHPSDGTQPDGPPWMTEGDVLSLCLSTNKVGWAVGKGGCVPACVCWKWALQLTDSRGARCQGLCSRRSTALRRGRLRLPAFRWQCRA